MSEKPQISENVWGHGPLPEKGGMPTPGQGRVTAQVEEFKYLKVLFMSAGREEWEIKRGIGAVAPVMVMLYQSIVVKRKLNVKANFSIYQSVYDLILTHGHELWVVPWP